MTRNEAVENIKALGWAPSYAEDFVKVLTALGLLKFDEPRPAETPEELLTGSPVAVVGTLWPTEEAAKPMRLTAHAVDAILRRLRQAGWVVRKKEVSPGGPIEDAVVEALTDSMLEVSIWRRGPRSVGSLQSESARMIYRHLHDLGFVIARDVEPGSVLPVNPELVTALTRAGYRIVRA